MSEFTRIIIQKQKSTSSARKTQKNRQRLEQLMAVPGIQTHASTEWENGANRQRCRHFKRRRSTFDEVTGCRVCAAPQSSSSYMRGVLPCGRQTLQPRVLSAVISRMYAGMHLLLCVFLGEKNSDIYIYVYIYIYIYIHLRSDICFGYV